MQCLFVVISFLFLFIVQAQWRGKQRQRGGEGGRGGKTMSRWEAVTEDNKGRGGEPVHRLRLRQGGVQATERSRTVSQEEHFQGKRTSENEQVKD